MRVVAIFSIDKEQYEYWKNHPKKHWRDWTIDDFILQAVVGGILEFAMDDMIDVEKVVLLDDRKIKILVDKK